MPTYTRECDAGTQVLNVRVDPSDDSQVLVFSYTDGIADLVPADRIDADTWADRVSAYVDAGYAEGHESPELRVTVDISNFTVSVAGGHEFDLMDPDLVEPYDDRDPVLLVDQADARLVDSGFLRTTSWWNCGSAQLVAVIVPRVETSIALNVGAAVRGVFSKARDVIADVIGWANPDMPSGSIADRIRLGDDVLSIDFADNLHAMLSRTYPAQLVGSMADLLIAIELAEKGDIAGSIATAEQALCRLSPIAGRSWRFAA